MRRAATRLKSSDEPTVEVGEPKEMPELGTVGGSSPFLHSPYLLRVGPHVPPLQDVAEELHRSSMENALLGLDVEPVLRQSLKDQMGRGGCGPPGSGKK